MSINVWNVPHGLCLNGRGPALTSFSGCHCFDLPGSGACPISQMAIACSTSISSFKFSNQRIHAGTMAQWLQNQLKVAENLLEAVDRTVSAATGVKDSQIQQLGVYISSYAMLDMLSRLLIACTPVPQMM